MVERREFRRHRVGGNVEITSVLGTGSAPQERATLLDCSLGGARVRVLSPRRRLFKALPPCLSPRDSLTCVLRLAPDYDAIDVFAEVVRVERAADEPEYIDVGVRFFHDAARRSHAERPMARLARIIEPDWSAEQARLAEAAAAAAAAARPSRRLDALPASTPERAAARSARLGRVGDATAGSSGSSQKVPRVSARLTAPEARASQRLERATSARQRPATGADEPRVVDSKAVDSKAVDSKIVDSKAVDSKIVDSKAVEREARASRRAARISARHELRTSGRHGRVSGHEDLDRGGEHDDRADREPRAGRVSGRLAGVRLDPERAAPSRAPSSDSEVVAWASSRLTAVAPPTERVATADDEVTVRGSARLIEGKAVIELPGAFTALAREAGMTAHVTPTADCAGMFVAERSPARLVVRELGGGRSAATFDYLVVATRRG